MSRPGSRTSRRCTPSIPTARAPPPRPRPNAGSRASRSARSTACPATIKENIATKGVPVPLGAASVKLVPAAVDAPPAARLREAGAVIFSKTTMPDYGMLSSGLSSFHPLTRNPWDLSKNPGGSSAGAGAGGGRRLRPAASRHRHRRLGAAAGLLVRPRRAEAEPRADSDRSALCRPRRRADDPHRRRRRPDDERAVAARSPRRHEPAARQHQLEGAGQAAAQAAHRPDARSRRRPGAGAGRARGRGEGRQGVRSPPAPSSPRSTAC